MTGLVNLYSVPAVTAAVQRRLTLHNADTSE
jgi:hypothetical protein